MRKIKNPDWQDINAAQILKVLVRNSDDARNPERKLWLAVLGQALNDTDVAFFSGVHKRDCNFVCAAAGLNPDFVRETVGPWVAAHAALKLRRVRRLI